MKKIIFVSNVSWNLYNFWLGFMKVFKEKGFEVVCVAPEDGYSHLLKEEGFKYVSVRIDRKGKSLFKDAYLTFQLYKIFKKEDPALIFNYTIKPNIYGSIAAYLAGKKCINTISGLGYMFASGRVNRAIAKAMYKISCAIARKTFFQNNENINFFIKNRIVDPTKAEIVKGTGVDTGHFNIEVVPKRDRSDAGFTFLFMGRMLWDKGISELIEATKVIKGKYPDTEIRLLGPIDSGNPSGIKRVQIDAWQKSGLVEYIAQVSDVRPLIASSDCILLPSYHEGLPRSILEASSMEKPVIVTDIAGCRDAVEGGVTGYLVPVKNSQKLAEAMQNILELSDEARLAMGKAGREKMVKEFDEKLVAETYLREAEKLI